MLFGAAPTEEYETQLRQKVDRTIKQFAHLYTGELNVYPSPASHFRMRAEFKIWYDKSTGKAHYAMHQPGVRNKPVVIERFEIGSKTINLLMPALLEQINIHEILRRKLFQAEFLTTTTGEAVISLIYHRPLDDNWQQQAQLCATLLGCSIIGRSRKQKIVIGKDYVLERLKVRGKELEYQQVETGFTQPNARICVAMLEWACERCVTFEGDLLELYCGNGNFTIPMSHIFKKVLATEVSKTSVKSALNNITRNHIGNIAVARLSSEEFTEALNGVREFRRLREIDLESYNFSTLFVDPPRAGLDSGTVELATRFENVLYISCNPDTLVENLESLSHSHTVTSMALFDQFPYTDHRECGVLLQKHGVARNAM